MEIRQLTDRIYLYPCEEERDRPLLGLIVGDRLSLAVDAGHSKAHVDDFYAALQRKGLPLPDVTALTHWHWDHTFGMHAVHGLTAAGRATNEQLKQILQSWTEASKQAYCRMDAHIAAEYAGGQDMQVVLADIVFEDRLEIDLGGVTAQLFRTVSPHTDDAVLVYVPEEKTLFIGDSLSGVYPTWEADPVKSGELLRTIEGIDCDYCLFSHWDQTGREDVLAQLRLSMQSGIS